MPLRSGSANSSPRAPSVAAAFPVLQRVTIVPGNIRRETEYLQLLQYHFLIGPIICGHKHKRPLPNPSIA
jgi:hypothetical protein